MKRYLLIILLGLGVLQAKAQDAKVSVLNDSTELHAYDNGQKIKVTYFLNGKTVSLKEKQTLIEKYSRLPQEFNIRTDGNDLIGEVRFTLPPGEYRPTEKNLQSVISAPVTVDITQPLAGLPFPKYSWRGINGVEYSSEQLKGKTIVLNFWHSSCGPCIAEMPLLNDLVRQYEKKNVVFIASTPNSIEEVLQFLGKKRFAYQHVADVDPQQLFSPFPGWPIHIIINGDGLIQFSALGKLKDIEKVLASHIDISLKEK